VHRLKLTTHTLKEPRYVYNVDGSNNKAGQITHSCQLELTYGGKNMKQQSFISDLGQDQALLGYPFLREFNPQVNWTQGKLHEAKGIIVQQNIYAPKRNIACEIIRIQHEAIKQVGPLKPGKTIYMRQTTFATQWAVAAEKGKQKEPQIPEEYEQHKIVFSEEAAKRFPPSCDENMKIKFIPGAPTNLDCKVYPLNHNKLNWMIKRIGEELDMGYIKEGDSPIVSPTFTVPKKQPGQFQMVVDYHKVNDMTIKDHYTMANAETELDKLKSKKIFTKFNIQAGYNNIIIEPEDCYKATFKTQIGTYTPQVMPFGLCNAPSLFQRATNRDFRTIKQKYPNDFAHFMDDMCIGTGDTPEELAKHQQIVHELLELFKKHSYFLKLSKCVFEAKEIEFLRFQVGYGVASIDQSKMDGLCNWPRTLSTVKEICQVLGVLGYQRPFIQNFAEIV